MTLLVHPGTRVNALAAAALTARRAERDGGRPYDAACIALEVATALEASGEPKAAAHAARRASSFLDPLGCVNPY